MIGSRWAAVVAEGLVDGSVGIVSGPSTGGGGRRRRCGGRVISRVARVDSGVDEAEAESGLGRGRAGTEASESQARLRGRGRGSGS